MSCVDLATLTLHRRHELEKRIHAFEEKCDRAINDIKHLKMKANGFVSHLSCDPSELKERFLNVMQKLDEYIYLVTDFNLAMAQTADTDSSENTPVQDNSVLSLPPSLSPFNLMDALTEPRPITSLPCTNLCPSQKPIRIKTPREEKLILFSSSSSAESMPKKSEKEQCEMVDDMTHLPIEEDSQTATAPSENNYMKCCLSAAQPVLEVDHEYSATIMNILEGGTFSVITNDLAEVTRFMLAMTEYYTNNKTNVSPEELVDMTYCAYLCDNGFYYRAMFLDEIKREREQVQVFVVDTGEIHTAAVECLQPLVKQFCDRPPYARFCHLAGIDLGEPFHNEKLMKQQEDFLKKYKHVQCTIVIDDKYVTQKRHHTRLNSMLSSSESLGVYVILPLENTTLNNLLVENNLAVPIDKPLRATQEIQSEEIHEAPPALHKPPPGFREPPSSFREPPPGFQERSPTPRKPISGPPPECSDEEWNLSDIDITQCPEYEDPVLAVTGYHNRDEADICKHYKGGPEKTCFKGSRCKKKHILHHPDGWTLDQVSITAKCKTVPLPAPGTCHRVLVTAVCHFDRVYVQMVEDEEEEEVPEFGVVLPPMTLAALQRDMNSPATVMAYKPLTLSPAPCEMVAAIYSDKCWYRAQVRTVTRADQCVEVMFVDYGTIMWVKEDQIRALEPRFLQLPLQAVQCALAGVQQRGDAAQWARAKRALADMVLERELDAHIIAREFDEVIAELITYDDPQEPTRGTSVAERLAAQGLVDLFEFKVPDSDVTQKLVVP